MQAIPEPMVTTKANCSGPGGSVERLSDAGGDVAQGSSLPESVTTRASTDPDEWKIAYVTEIYKKSGREIGGNYRPISFDISCMQNDEKDNPRRAPR